MTQAIASDPRTQRRRWTLAEKRRIVEQTLQAGASVAAISREHGISRNSIRQWQLRYRADKMGMRRKSTPATADAPASTTFVPVKVAQPVRRSSMGLNDDSRRLSGGGGVVQLVLATGATLRIETSSLDATLVCALVAELRR